MFKLFARSFTKPTGFHDTTPAGDMSDDSVRARRWVIFKHLDSQTVQLLLDRVMRARDIHKGVLNCKIVEAVKINSVKSYLIHITIEEWSDSLAAQLPSIQVRLIRELHALDRKRDKYHYAVSWGFSRIICHLMDDFPVRSRQVKHGALHRSRRENQRLPQTSEHEPSASFKSPHAEHSFVDTIDT